MVVLPELDAELVGQPPSFVVSRENPVAPVTAVCRYVNADVQRLLPQRFQQMFTDDAARSVAESLCVLYVALTRAVHALYMIIPPSPPSERNLPKRYSGLLRAALSAGQPAGPDQVLYQCGQSDWYRQLAQPQVAPAPRPAPVGPIRLASSGRRPRNLERQSPSLLEGGARLSIRDILGVESAPARQRGTLVHALLESIEWLDGAGPNRSALREIARQRLRQTPDKILAIDPLLDDLERMLARPAAAALFDPASYRDPAAWGLPSGSLRAEVRREHTFAAPIAGQLWTGSIDRLVLLSQGDQLVAADLIDFKTDHIGPDQRQIESKVAFYRPQILAYRQAVAQITGLPPPRIRARLLLLASGDVVDVRE
jgi:ATP-dependent exoDNAse (exonuclease V) beta subunit